MTPKDQALTFQSCTTEMASASEHQSELFASREQLRLAKESAGIGFYDNDLRAGRKVWDERVRQLLDLEVDAPATDTHFWTKVHPEDHAMVKSAIERAFAPNGSGEYFAEYRTIGAKDSASRWVTSKGRVYFENGKAVRFIGAMQDVTESKQIEAALRKSEASLKRAQEIAHLGSWELNLDTNCLTWSDEVYRIFGLQPQEFSATYEAFLERVHPDDRAAVHAAYSGSVREGRESYEIEHRVVRRDTGQIRYVLEKCRHVRDVHSRIVSSMGMVLDNTERKAAEEALRESEARLRTISEASFDGIIIHGDSKIIDVNEAFAHMYGYTVAELIGKPLLDLYLQESHDIISYHVGNGLENPYEVQAIRKDGSMFLAEVRGRNTLYKGLKVRGGTHRDITERRRAEEELKSSREALRLANEDLEEKVRSRSQKLTKTVRKLEMEIERRSQVEQELTRRAVQLRALAGELTTTEQRERKRLAKVLHDGMQQYLVAAKLQMEGVIEACAGRSVQQSAGQVEKLLQESLQVSRSLAAELSPPILHDAGIVAALEWLTQWQHQKHGLKVKLVSEIEAPKLAEDVKALVFESVRELLLNVIKHSGTKAAEIRLSRTKDRMLRVNVEDAGKGFDPALLNACAMPDSGGFGLFSIRERIQLIGGSFEADSTLGKGARFTLTVPMSIVEPQKAARPARLSQGILTPNVAPKGKIRILLTDDHIVMREGLARLLGQEPDMEIVGQAADGQEAVEIVGRLLPDVILMDLSMPRLDGVAATKLIHQQHPKIQIIGLSLYTADERAREMIKAGAAFYLSKAGPPSELKDAIRACYGKDCPC